MLLAALALQSSPGDLLDVLFSALRSESNLRCLYLVGTFEGMDDRTKGCRVVQVLSSA